MIDPQVRDQPASVTLLQYENSGRDFLSQIGCVQVTKIDIALHLNEVSRLYGNRDFAVGETFWTDARGREHVFRERWVRAGRSWFMRSTGFLLPARADETPAA